MKKYLPSILAAASALLTIFTPQIQALIASHPALSASLAAVYAIISHLLPSPSQAK